MIEPTMTREGRAKRQQAWAAGQHVAEALAREVREEALAYPPEERIEFWYGIGQYFGRLGYLLARGEEE